ncbi:hypothetical protein HLB44_03080 [Aquincola sp. S2]|uniref:Uncharacterized protein n=1 Tax=Pseudaquabacterium terrae TaxID=2732868 RepID=A0ABX2ED94_9BURK|nr:hypothetical protein [Aquabacterium terrae]NRF65965.1 hypothetical protein [Aquabacterium terrae]
MNHRIADLLNAADPLPCDESVISIDEAATTLTESSWRRGVPLNRDAVLWLLTNGSAAPRLPAESTLTPAGCATARGPGR